MSRFRDFDAARAAARGEPITFKLGGETFTACAELPAGVLLDLGAATTSDNVIAAMDLFAELFRVIVAPEDAERFAKVTRTVGLETLFELVQWIVEESTGRPFTNPSSSPGPQSLGGGSSNGDSVSWVATP